MSAERGMNDIGFHFAVIMNFFVSTSKAKQKKKEREKTNQRIKWISHGQRRWEVLEGYDFYSLKEERASKVERDWNRECVRERKRMLTVFSPKVG